MTSNFNGACPRTFPFRRITTVTEPMTLLCIGRVTGIGTLREAWISSINFVKFGIATDVPVPGDYDGDGKYDIAVFRDGVWYILGSSAGLKYEYWGNSTDVPLPRKYLP